MKDENEKLQASMNHLTGEDLSSMNINDLQQLEHQLQFSVDRVRARKVYMSHLINTCISAFNFSSIIMYHMT